MDLIIADSDRFYTAALADRLRRWDKADHVTQCSKTEELHQLIAERKGDKSPACFLFNPVEFNALLHLPHKSVWPDCWLAVPILPGQTTVDLGEKAYHGMVYHRFDTVGSLINQLASIDTHHAKTVSGSMSVSEKKAGEPKTEDQRTAGSLLPAESPTADAKLWLHISLSNPNQKSASRQRLEKLVAVGRQVIYLPLMPTYLMDTIHERTQGPTLSDLLLRLLGDAIKVDDLGCYWQTGTSSFLCFRPPERSDDLLTCDLSILRRLILLLREKAVADPTGQMLFFIDCRCLPLTAAATVGVLCDVCELEMPQGQNFMARAAQTEGSRLLAKLPASCQVIRCMCNDSGKKSIKREGGSGPLVRIS